MTADELAAAPHFVYRLRDAEGSLLYIGCTVDPAARFATHTSDQPWADLIDHQDVEGPFDRAEALAREAAAITAEAPRFNVRHNPTPERPPRPSDKAFLFVQARVNMAGRGIGRAFYNAELPLEPTDDDVRRWVRTLRVGLHPYPCWPSCWCHYSEEPVEQIETGTGWPGSDLCPMPSQDVAA